AIKVGQLVVEAAKEEVSPRQQRRVGREGDLGVGARRIAQRWDPAERGWCRVAHEILPEAIIAHRLSGPQRSVPNAAGALFAIWTVGRNLVGGARQQIGVAGRL